MVDWDHLYQGPVYRHLRGYLSSWGPQLSHIGPRNCPSQPLCPPTTQPPPPLPSGPPPPPEASCSRAVLQCPSCPGMARELTADPIETSNRSPRQVPAWLLPVRHFSIRCLQWPPTCSPCIQTLIARRGISKLHTWSHSLETETPSAAAHRDPVEPQAPPKWHPALSASLPLCAFMAPGTNHTAHLHTKAHVLL